MKNKRTAYFLCSPNLGLLDSWLPVIHKMKELNQDFNYVFLLPHSRNITAFNIDNTIVKIANNVFDSVVLYSPSGLWIKVDSIKSVIRNSYFLWRLVDYYLIICNRIPFLKKFFFLIRTICMIIDKARFRDNIRKIHDIILKDDILLYDMQEHFDDIANIVISEFEVKNNFRFSIPHGIVFKRNLVNIKKLSFGQDNKKLSTFLFSKELGYKFYLKRFSIKPSNISDIGVPRHDQEWIEKIQKNSADVPINFNDNDTVFIASSPVSKRMPKERKIRYFSDIKSIIIDDLKMKVIVKLHPKEIRDGICEKVFEKKYYGEKWVYSDLHAFVLAKDKRLAITFYSGVAFDMLRLGVPCIEYLDLKGIPQWNTKYQGPITPLTQYGIVYSVTNAKELKTQINNILKDANYESLSKRKYNKYFPINGKSSIRAATNIIEKGVVNID